MVGFHGETLRGLDLTLSRRGGAIKSLALSAKLGRDAALSGELRGRNGTRQVVYVEAKDAGRFFRFTDIYPKLFGGEMCVAMDPPTADPARPRKACSIFRTSRCAAKPSLDRVVAGASSSQHPGVDFSRLRVEFTRTLGRFSIRDGIVSGPMIGATVDGYVDYLKDDVRMRGTFVPLYGLNNMFGQIPLFGIFLGGGSREGLVGVTYEVVGPTNAPVLRVNPISAVAPGLLRKFFEFPTGQTPVSATSQNPNGQYPNSPFSSSRLPGGDGPIMDRACRRATPTRGKLARCAGVPLMRSARSGRSRMCRLRPSESLITPSGVRCPAAAASFRRSRQCR